ncbi:Aldose 1-epimerase [Blattella germanica]|nr:Aldose 1-epimerase [Blattella germanica]
MLSTVVVFLVAVNCALCVTITKKVYGQLEDQTVLQYTFSNDNNVTVDIITYGARIANVLVPDKDGNVDDVVLGFDDLQGYASTSDPYFGATLGRVANRIGGAKFVIDGVQYNVTKNEGQNQLHGGLKGFDKAVWDSYVDETSNTLILSYLSKDGEEGFPGAVLMQVTYELTENNELIFAVEALSTKPTPVNTANHAYFNLAGQASGPTGLFQHIVSINADSYTETDSQSIPTGVLLPVDDTDLDFRIPKELGPLIHKRGGYDNNFVVNDYSSIDPVFVSRVDHPQSGRFMEVWSDQPGVQMYTGNGLPQVNSNNPIIGKGGVHYQQYGSISLETQDFPDAVNHPNFPDSVLTPGETYEHTTIYKFGVSQEVRRHANCGKRHWK